MSVTHQAAFDLHDISVVASIFDRAFAHANTRLLPHPDAWRRDFRGGFATEPVYLPADEDCPFNRIVFAHGFFASALHEVAHWCIAGERRRRLVDYGYWYAPDGRDAGQQAEFERVEAKPQAIEWAFAIACGFPFRVSVDNLSGIAVDRESFTRKVHAELVRCSREGFPPRAQRFMDALSNHYGHRFEVPALG